jgi:outer membrane receptor protein involved in Fe transport
MSCLAQKFLREVERSRKENGRPPGPEPGCAFGSAFSVSYVHNGERREIDLGGSPVGPTLPAFTTHALRGGVNLFRVRSMTHSVTVGVANLTNRLYSEASNTSFFRPEPGRNFIVSWRMGF